MLDIRDFGPVDPTGVRDCTAALQNAINAVANGTASGPIFVPAGTFLIQGQITIPNTGGALPQQRSIRIIGSGRFAAESIYSPYGGTTLDMRYGLVRSFSDGSTQTAFAAPALAGGTNVNGYVPAGNYAILYGFYSTSPAKEWASLVGFGGSVPLANGTLTVTAPSIPSGYNGMNVYLFPGPGVTGLRIASVTTNSVTLLGNPAPTPSNVVSGGIPPGTYNFQYTFYNASTETFPSASLEVIQNTSFQITINTPTIPTGYTGINVYVTTGGTIAGKVGSATTNSLTLNSLNPADVSILPPSLVSTTGAANFTSADVGRFLVGNGLAAGTIITAVINSSSVLTYPTPTANAASGVSITINGPKILTLGSGSLVLEHLTLKDGGTDTAPFILSTGTTLNLSDVGFYGTVYTNPANAQDAIVLGGSRFAYDGTASSAFGGFGSVMENLFFQNVRRAVLFRSSANGNTLRDTMIWQTCGAIVRTFSDGATTANSPILSSGGLANFSALDVGRFLVGAGIPPSTYILSYQSSTQVTMSQNATQTSGGNTVGVDILDPGVGAVDLAGVQGHPFFVPYGNLIEGVQVEAITYPYAFRIDYASSNTLLGNTILDQPYGVAGYLLTGNGSGNFIAGGTLATVEDKSGGQNTVINPSGTNFLRGGFLSPLSLPAVVPSGITVLPIGTTGSTTYGYRVSAVSAQGVETLAAATVQITNGNATLSSTNFNQVTIPNVVGAVSYNVYGRTAGSEQFMQNVAATGGTATWNDIGVVTPGGALPGNPVGNKAIIQAWQSQTNNLQEWQNSGGTVLDNVGNDGRLYVQSPNTAPTDANILNSQITFYLDETNGNLKVRVRYSNGTYKTATIGPLGP